MVEFSDDIVEFVGFSKADQRVTKPYVMGRKLWTKLFERKPKFGGITCSFYGVPGSGKTSLMLQICRQIAKENPAETIFWREPHGVPMQILNLGVPVRFFSDSETRIQIHELIPTGSVPSEDYTVRRFRHIGELLQQVEPGINVVYFHDRKGWLRLIQRMKSNLSWQSFFLDECEDLFSSRVGGNDWYVNEEFCAEIKEVRKARVSMYLNSQTDWDIDPRIKSKLMFEVYLYGSKKNKDSPLYRGVLQDIELGEGWITYAHSLFGKIRFDPVEPKDKQYIAVPNGGNPTEYDDMGVLDTPGGGVN